jgi:hypothetical protein
MFALEVSIFYTGMIKPIPGLKQRSAFSKVLNSVIEKFNKSPTACNAPNWSLTNGFINPPLVSHEMRQHITASTSAVIKLFLTSSLGHPRQIKQF